MQQHQRMRQHQRMARHPRLRMNLESLRESLQPNGKSVVYSIHTIPQSLAAHSLWRQLQHMWILQWTPFYSFSLPTGRSRDWNRRKIGGCWALCAGSLDKFYSYREQNHGDPIIDYVQSHLASCKFDTETLVYIDRRVYHTVSRCSRHWLYRSKLAIKDRKIEMPLVDTSSGLPIPQSLSSWVSHGQK